MQSLMGSGHGWLIVGLGGGGVGGGSLGAIVALMEESMGNSSETVLFKKDAHFPVPAQH